MKGSNGSIYDLQRLLMISDFLAGSLIIDPLRFKNALLLLAFNFGHGLSASSRKIKIYLLFTDLLTIHQTHAHFLCS